MTNWYRFTEIMLYTLAGYMAGANDGWWFLPLLALGAYCFARIDQRSRFQ